MNTKRLLLSAALLLIALASIRPTQAVPPYPLACYNACVAAQGACLDAGGSSSECLAVRQACLSENCL